MANSRVEDKLQRANDLRKQAKNAQTRTLQRAIESAAERMERSAAKQLSKVGRPVNRRR